MKLVIDIPDAEIEALRDKFAAEVMAQRPEKRGDTVEIGGAAITMVDNTCWKIVRDGEETQLSVGGLPDAFQIVARMLANEMVEKEMQDKWGALIESQGLKASSLRIDN